MLKPYSPVWWYWNRVYKEVINVKWYQKGGALINKIQFSHSVISNSLQPHGLQHTRLPCPSPTPRVYSNSCASSQWCHPTISSFVFPFSSHLQSFPASGYFPMSRLFVSGGQNTRASTLASVLPMIIQGWFPLGLTDWNSLLSKDLSTVLAWCKSNCSFALLIFVVWFWDAFLNVIMLYFTLMCIYCIMFFAKNLFSSVSVRLLSRVQLFATPWTAAHQASLSNTKSRSPPKLMSVESVMPSNHLILCLPLLLLPSIFPSISVFSNESALLIRWPKYWSFSISPSSEFSGVISFRIDWSL